MSKLESWFNPEATKAVEDYNHGKEMTLDQVNLALFSTVAIKEPTTYEEAINSENKKEQIKWNSAIDKDLKEMEKRGVWEIIDEKNIPINHRCIKNKWIFKVKRNGKSSVQLKMTLFYLRRTLIRNYMRTTPGNF
jgi:hypothetical protein